MASTPQTKFDVVLPTIDQAVPPNALVVGDITQIDIEVTVDGVLTVYTAPVDPAAVPGSTVELPFGSVTPAFAPVPGKAYAADAFVVDANGNGAKSTSVSWTQVAVATPPAAPGFSVG